jgi:branched-chain amino acid transport system ATP-binding protein
MTALLEVEELDVHYGGIHALQKVSFAVDEGQIVALIGANGAGKTTALRAISGLVRASGGRVRFAGQPITGLPAHAIVARGLAHVPEGRGIFANLTVEENLRVPQAAPGAWTEARVYGLFPRLAERKQQLGRQLSGGEQEMLAIARPLLLNPKLMLLDEPSQGLAPLVVREVMQVVRSMREQGLSVLLVEQNVPLSLAIADRAYIISDGRVVYSGAAAELARDTELVHKLAGAGGSA